MDIINMLPGREKDCLIAEKVMGYSIYHYDKDHPDNCYYMLMDNEFNPVNAIYPSNQKKTEAEAWEDCPNFSTDIAAAFEVVEKIRKDLNGWIGLQLLSDVPGTPPGTWLACFGGGRQNTVFATTAPDAICKAALNLWRTGMMPKIKPYDKLLPYHLLGEAELTIDGIPWDASNMSFQDMTTTYGYEIGTAEKVVLVSSEVGTWRYYRQAMKWQKEG